MKVAQAVDINKEYCEVQLMSFLRVSLHIFPV